MKRLQIEVRIDDSDGKIATAIKDEGFNKDSISNQLELLGIIENIKSIINSRIKELTNIRE